MSHGDLAGALPLAEESLAVARTVGDPCVLGDALSILIQVVGSRGDMARARALLGESTALLGRPDAHLDPEGREQIVTLGVAARSWGEYGAARALWEDAIALSRRAGDRRSVAGLRVFLALLEREQGRYNWARSLLEESLSEFEELDIPGGAAHALIGLADVARDQGDAEQTIALSEQSLELFRERGDRFFVAFCLHNLALAAWSQGDYARAESLLAEALASKPGSEERAEFLASSGLVALDQGEYARAEQAFAESLGLGREANIVYLATPSLEGMAGVAVGKGQMERAARLFGAADAIRTALGTPIRPLHRALYDRHVTAVEAALGETQCERLRGEGRAMTLSQAIDYALTGDTP
jgi:tetratricopeptide (TPR) repeat protein